MTCKWPAPMQLADSMYGRWRMPRTALRTTREVPGASRMPRMQRHAPEARPDHRDQADQQHQGRERDPDVHQPLDQQVDPAAEVAGDARRP